MKFKKVLLLALLCSSVLVGCEEHPSFKTSVDAVEGCKKELAELKEMDDVSVENLAKATSAWLEIQDSAYSVFSRDTTINLRSPVAMAYFVVSDSIRGELKRLAFANPRSLRDVMYLKLNTATARKKIEKSDVYKEALDFYDKLDKQDTYPNLTKTLIVYSALLHNAKPFKHESELLGFISEEDRCFRSLMKFLSQVSNEQLQQLTDATASIFDGLYSSVGRKVDDVNDRTMLYLTMRFNRRIVQNALACKQDVENGKKRSHLQRANYRWMLIQYKEALDFYDKLDKQDTYPNLTKTLIVYSALLHNAKPFKHESELLGFISEEDRCFRSLMKFLSQVSNEQLQQLTDATASIFDGLYSSVGRKVDDVNDRTMLYLTMRFNRRIVQNALACKQDVENGKKLSHLQRANYRWMLIQPFMAIDDYSTAALTSKQKEELLDMSNELPMLLNKLELEKQTKEEEDKFTKVLSEYFLKSYLSTSL